MPCNALRRVYPYQLKEWLEATDIETKAFVESAAKEGIIRIKFDFICNCGNANTACDICISNVFLVGGRNKAFKKM